MSLYDSLDDLLQAADDHEDEGGNEEATDKGPLTAEELEKKQECVSTIPPLRFTHEVLGLKASSLHSSFSYRYSPLLAR